MAQSHAIAPASDVDLARAATRPIAPDAEGFDRPPRAGWYWNDCRLARAWLPLIGPEGLGLLDLYLALADGRPGSPQRGWAAVTLAELTRLTGWGRARLVRLNRALAAAGLLAVRLLPVAGRGPAVRRALYRVERAAPPPDAARLAALAALAADDPTLAARMRRFAGNGGRADGQAGSWVDRTIEGGAADEMGVVGMEEEAAGAAVPAASVPVSPVAPVPVPQWNRFVEKETRRQGTTTTTRACEAVAMARDMVRDAPSPGTGEAATLAAWAAANGRPASALERQRLAQIAEGAATAAREAGDGDGWAWVEAAVVEAVEAGSAFVAPRRVARIVERWTAARDRGAAAQRDDGATERRSGGARETGRWGTDERRGGARAQTGSSGDAADDGAAEAAEPEAAAAAEAIVSPVRLHPVPPAPLPAHLAVPVPGLPFGAAATLRAALGAAGLTGDAYLSGAVLAGWSDEGALLVATPAPLPPAVAGRLRARLAEGLRSVLGRAVACQLVTAREAGHVGDGRG